MKKSVRSILIGIVSLSIAGAGVSVTPTANAQGTPPASEIYLAQKKPSRAKTVTLKCPVVNLRNEATGRYIYGRGKTKSAAHRDANNQLGRKMGKGYKLKHCRVI